MRPKVSVIIPCHNYEKYIEQCIMSVLLQRVDCSIEIVIGDDNSTDDSLKTITRIKNFYQSSKYHFNIIHHDTSIGEINNTKSLIENSTGEYIAYLDADDYWTDPNKLASQIEFMDNNPDYSMCITGHVLLVDDKFEPTVDFSTWLCPVNTNVLNPENLANSNVVGSSSSRLFRNYNDLIKSYFYEFPYSDWPLNFELSLKGKIGFLNYPSFVYRRHEKSLFNKNFNEEIDKHQELNDKRKRILSDILNKKLYNN